LPELRQLTAESSPISLQAVVQLNSNDDNEFFFFAETGALLGKHNKKG